MPRKIAVYVGENGETTSLSKKGKLIIYEKREGEWLKHSEENYDLEEITAIKYLRIKIEEIIVFLDDCNVFVGRSVIGIPYYMLEKANKSIWEYMGKPLEFLNDILEKEEKADLINEGHTIDKKDLVPVEISPGYYRVSIKKIQAYKTMRTSKQVLMPFLEKEKFKTLEILCNHVPMWLEGFCLSNNLDLQKLEFPFGKIKVIISKKENENGNIY